jgi:hypothetical protein
MEMSDLHFFTKWTDQTETSGSINMPFLNVVDAKVHWVVTTGKKVSKLPGLSILEVNQREDVIKNGRP